MLLTSRTCPTPSISRLPLHLNRHRTYSSSLLHSHASSLRSPAFHEKQSTLLQCGTASPPPPPRMLTHHPTAAFLRTPQHSKRRSVSALARKRMYEPNTLNPSQLDAVTDESEAIYLKAGPGTGKTRVIMERVRMRDGLCSTTFVTCTFHNNPLATTLLSVLSINWVGQNRIYIHRI